MESTYDVVVVGSGFGGGVTACRLAEQALLRGPLHSLQVDSVSPFERLLETERGSVSAQGFMP